MFFWMIVSSVFMYCFIYIAIYAMFYLYNVLGYVLHSRKSGYSLWKNVIYVSLKKLKVQK